MDREALLQEASEDHLLQEAGRRRFLYKDVEKMVQNHFLTHALDFGTTRVVLRTIFPSEYHWCESVAKNPDDYYSWVLACSVWVVDGEEIPPRSGPGRRLVYKSWTKNLTRPEIEAYSSILKGLRNRVNRAIRMSYAFMYEPYSRSMWRLLGRPQDSFDANLVRKSWAAFNMAEDRNKRDAQEWDRTTVIVGSLSGKAAKHVTQSLDKREQAEKARRQKAVEETVNWAVYGEQKEENLKVQVGGKTYDVPAISAPTTLADLEAEMRKVMSGELDYHDQLVEDHHNRVREGVESRRTEARKRQDESRRKREVAESAGGATLVGYTPEQLKELNPRISRGKTTGLQAHSSNNDRLYSRYVSPKIVPGVLTPDLKVVNAGEKKGSGKSLQEKVAGRKPKLRGG